MNTLNVKPKGGELTPPELEALQDMYFYFSLGYESGRSLLEIANGILTETDLERLCLLGYAVRQYNKYFITLNGVWRARNAGF